MFCIMSRTLLSLHCYLSVSLVKVNLSSRTLWPIPLFLPHWPFDPYCCLIYILWYGLYISVLEDFTPVLWKLLVMSLLVTFLHNISHNIYVIKCVFFSFWPTSLMSDCKYIRSFFLF